MTESVTESSPAADARPVWLFVLPWSLEATGGVNQVVVDLYRVCDREGTFRPLVLVADWSERQGRVVEERGCRVLRMRLPGFPSRAASMPLWALASFPCWLRLWRLLKQERVRVVNVHYPGQHAASLVLLSSVGTLRAKIILTFHGMDLAAIRQTKGLLRRGWEWIVSRCWAMTACSGALAQEVKSAFPQAETPIFAVLNGIDAQRVREDAAAGRSAAALQPYVVNLATLEPKKGQDLLIKAFAKLPAAFSDFRLVIAGFDAGSGPALRALAAELGVAERVHLLGDLSRPDALAVCRGGTLFVLSSRAEPFGLVVLEAAVLGVPVVAHRVGGVPEIVAGSEFGTLVEVGAVDDLAAAIASLLGDAGRRRQLSSALRGRVEREFTWANSFAQLMAVAQGGTGQSQR